MISNKAVLYNFHFIAILFAILLLKYNKVGKCIAISPNGLMQQTNCYIVTSLQLSDATH